MPLSLVELQILASLSAGETLTTIGERLGLGHPAVSRSLQALQRRTRLTLAEQRGRRLYLTAAGEHLARRAEALLAEHQRMERVMSELCTGTGGPLRIAATPTPHEYVLRSLVADFAQVFPRAEVQLDVVLAPDVWQVVKAKRYDLGVGIRPDNDGWLVDSLYEDRHLLCVTPTSPLAQRETVSWSELRGETFIGPFSVLEWDSLWGEGTHERFRDVRRVDLVGIEGIKRLAEVGGGIAVMFESAVRQELNNNLLWALPVVDFSCSHKFCLARPAGARALPIVEQFRSYVLGRLGRGRVEVSPALTC